MRRIGVAALVLLSACASTASRTSASTEQPQRYAADATVLQAPGGAPELCLGGVLSSLPPQCGGPEIVNWDWATAPDEESAGGTTWGEYHVTGTFDGERFTLTQPPEPRRPAATPPADMFKGPCPEPAGGWRAADPKRAGGDDQTKAIEQARSRPDFAGVWIDENGSGPTILNVVFTGDPERHEREIAGVWGGALCVSKAGRTLQELRSIQRDLQNHAGELDVKILSVGVDEIENVVAVTVIVSHDDTQDRIDERYGARAVRIDAVLQPVS